MRRASEPGRRTSLGSAIVRRAIDLALDGRLSLDDGAHHLCRVANGELAPLDAALRELPSAPDARPDVECAPEAAPRDRGARRNSWCWIARVVVTAPGSSVPGAE